MKALPKILLALTAVAGFSLAHPASVQAVPITYQYTGNPFTTVTQGGPYTTSMFVTAMITLAGPLAPNFSGSVIPTAFSLFDGVQTITNLNASGSQFSFSTNGTGTLTGWTMLAVAGQSLISSSNSSGSIQDTGSTATDTFGTNRLAPGVWTIAGSVPDTGSTLLLMMLTLIALGLVARRFQRPA